MDIESPVGRQCHKCDHVRKKDDTGPAWACPACGAVYAKVQAIVTEREAIAREAARQGHWDKRPAGGVPPPPRPPATLALERRRVARVQLAYLLLALPLVVPGIAGAVIVRGIAAEQPPSWLSAHARWQLRTFWTALVLGVVLALLAALLIGGAALSARMAGGAPARSAAGWLWLPTIGLWLWMLYRSAIGWLLLQRGDSP